MTLKQLQLLMCLESLDMNFERLLPWLLDHIVIASITYARYCLVHCNVFLYDVPDIASAYIA